MLVNCVICSDFLQPSANICATPCGHVFHYHCLSQWMERSKSCPQCRNKANDKNIIKIYLNYTSDLDASIDAGTLMQKLDTAQSTINEKDTEIKKTKEALDSYKKSSRKSASVIKELEDKVQTSNILIKQYRNDMQMLKICRDELNNAKIEATALKAKIKGLETVDSILHTSVSESEEILKNENNPQTLAVLIVALKRELRGSEMRRNELRSSMKALQNDLKFEQISTRKLEEKLSLSESENNRLVEEMKKTDKREPTVDNSTISSSPSLLTQRPTEQESKSNSPYLRVKSSSVGLSPLCKFDKTAAAEKKPSLRADKYLIFKKPRLSAKTSQIINPQLVFNGLGGTERKENYPFNPISKTKIDIKQKLANPFAKNVVE